MKAQDFLKIKKVGDAQSFENRVKATYRKSPLIQTGKNAPAKAQSVDVFPKIRKTKRLH